MKEPWGKKAVSIFGITEKDYHGNCNYTEDQLAEVVLAATEKGFNFICHATGDGAVDLVLKAYERVDENIPIKDKRFQLLHGNFFSTEILDKCAKLGILLDLQPAWFYKDLEALPALIGEKRMERFHPYRDMADRGLLICSGTDHMAKFDPYDSINPYNPFFGLYALTTHKSEKGTLFQPEQALTRMEALKTYTINNAFKSGEERIKGSIEKGKLADFVILEKNILSCGEEELLKMKVLATYAGGKRVYGQAE
jgi:predicted amidohydrolase YtcJ